MSRIRTNNRISKLQRAKPLSLGESAFAQAQITVCSSKGQALQLTSGLDFLSIQAYRLWMEHPSRRNVKASYTEDARRNRIEGEVILNVVFAADGAIHSIRVVRGLPDGLTEKAIEAAKKTRFRPAIENGVPVSVRGDLSFTFSLY